MPRFGLFVALASLTAMMMTAAACSGGGSKATPDAAAPDSSTTDAGASDSASAEEDASDPTVVERENCVFEAGAMAAQTIGDSNLAAARQKIAHVIIMMKENRSFDEMFGGLADGGKTGVELPPPGWSNPDLDGGTVPIFHATNTCYLLDPEHQGPQTVEDWDNGAMDGFVRNAQANSDNLVTNTTNVPSDGHFVMAEFAETDLPFYYFLARTYALGDHYFCSALSGTWANRLYSVAASSYGVVNTTTDFPSNGIMGHLIFDAMTAANVTWAVYTDSSAPLEYSLLTTPLDHAHVHPTAQFFSDLTAGALPSVVFVEGNSSSDPNETLTSTDEHPPTDVQAGEAWSKSIYDALIASSAWYDQATGSSSVLLWTYDENGSFADHLPPPAACPPSDATSSDLIYFSHYGPRVPFVAISPYARPGYVSHVVHSHTSMLRLIEAVWNLGALTVRDANSDALLDMFDFDNPALAIPPLEWIAATGGCNRDGGP